MPDISPLITSRADNINLYALANQYPITQITGPGVIGTLTRANPTVQTTISYPFKTGTYYVCLQVEIDITTSATGDLLICSTAQTSADLTDIIQTENMTSLAGGEAVRVMLSGYINTSASSPQTLSVIVSTYTSIGVSSSYSVQIPTDSVIYIQQVA